MIEPKVIFPTWGRYGIRVEVKMPNDKFKNTKLLISEVSKDEQAQNGWRFFMRNFNDNQRERGCYNAHCSISTDVIPSLLAELLDIWKRIRPTDSEDISDEIHAVAEGAKYGENAREILRESKDMAELHVPEDMEVPPKKQARPRQSISKANPKPEQGGDPWALVKNKKGGATEPSEPEPDSGGPDDYIPF